MKNSRRTICWGIAILGVFSLTLCGCAPKRGPASEGPAGAGRDTLTQYSALGSLMNGVYDGEMTLGQLSHYGDYGLGTFQRLDGEMIVLDGQFYQVTADGQVHFPDPGAQTPFAAVTWFEPDQKVALAAGANFEAAVKALDRVLPSRNLFYAVKIEGTFSKVKARSVPSQTPPYPPLPEVTKNQPVFTFENIEGTLVGFRCPAYVKGVNAPGWHLHFLGKDKKSGGHMLDFVVSKAEAQIDHTNQWTTILPGDAAFYATNLESSQSQDLKRVER